MLGIVHDLINEEILFTFKPVEWLELLLFPVADYLFHTHKMLRYKVSGNNIDSPFRLRRIMTTLSGMVFENGEATEFLTGFSITGCNQRPTLPTL
jgi:hypothetical protein